MKGKEYNYILHIGIVTIIIIVTSVLSPFVSSMFVSEMVVAADARSTNLMNRTSPTTDKVVICRKSLCKADSLNLSSAAPPSPSCEIDPSEQGCPPSPEPVNTSSVKRLIKDLREINNSNR
jgi:hypothetical protein